MNGIIDVKIDTDNGNISPDLVVGDIVISKAATGRDTHTYRAVVNKVTSDTITLVTTTQTDCDKAKLWVRVGNVNDTDRQAYIVMDSEGSDAPKIAMYDNVDDVDKIGSVDTLKLILGNLDNISVPEFVSMNGYGLYAENVYLKGQMILAEGSSISFADLRDTGNTFTYIDANGVYTGTLTAEQVNAVDINASSITTGTIDAIDITGSNITGSVIQGGTLKTSNSGKRVIINDNDNNGILIYDDNVERMSINKNGDGAMIYRDKQGVEAIRIDDEFIQIGTELFGGIRLKANSRIAMGSGGVVDTDWVLADRLGGNRSKIEASEMNVWDESELLPNPGYTGITNSFQVLQNVDIEGTKTYTTFKFVAGVLVGVTYS